MVHKQVLDPKLQKRLDEQFTYALNKVLKVEFEQDVKCPAKYVV